MEDDTRISIYKAVRKIKRRENSLYNSLRSIYEDSIFVGEISQLWPELPVLANLRCGLWYFKKFHSNCYFKSTDGHNNNWSFSTSRLNLHVAQLAGEKGGCMIVDSTRRGKRFPDSMSKTIPIWTCVLNRSINNHRLQENGDSSISNQSWDCSLHLPLWVSDTEKAAIEEHLDEWTKQLDSSGADIASLALSLKKPLRPLWISQKSIIWLNEVPGLDSWDFTPIILVSASLSTGAIERRTTTEFSWNYIAGAGDDEESWSRGLSPTLFWTHVYDLMNSGPDLCNQKVADLVEKDRVYRARRGIDSPQVAVKSQKIRGEFDVSPDAEQSLFSYDHIDDKVNTNCSSRDDISWLGSTNLGVCSSQYVSTTSNVDSVINCGVNSVSLSCVEANLHVPMVTSKVDRFSLSKNLPSALDFAKAQLTQGKTLIICCSNGEDISICVCLAILVSLFDEEGVFDGGECFKEKGITKWEMKRRLVFVCKYAVNARPSRGNLRQIFNFLATGRTTLLHA